jgi:spermidine synthase
MTLALALLFAALSGFLALSYEVVWYRVFSFATGGTSVTFALLLGFYLYGLAGGGLIAARICRDRAPARRGEFVLYLSAFVLAAALAAYGVIPLLVRACGAGLCLAALPGVTVAAALLGSVLPIICHLAIRPGALAGARLSYVYAANTLGSVGGTLLTGYLLLDVWPAARVALLLGAMGVALAGLLLFVGGVSRAHRLGAGGGLAAAAAALFVLHPHLLDRLYERLLLKSRFTEDARFAHVLENRVGVIAISKTGVVYGGGVYDGRVNVDLRHDANWLIRAAAIPAFHPRPRRVLMLGLSMGAWAQLIANLPGVDSLTIVEINPGYLQLIPQYPSVASLLHNPKVTIVVDDGRRWLARHPEAEFDLVVANLTFHWRDHMTNLLSVEYLEMVRRHLDVGGVYYFNTTGSEDAIKTALGVFRHGFRFLNFVAVTDSPAEFDRVRWERVLRSWQIDGKPLLDSAVEADAARIRQLVGLAPEGYPDQHGVLLEPEEPLRASTPGSRVITDDNMVTEWRVAAADLVVP